MKRIYPITVILLIQLLLAITFSSCTKMQKEISIIDTSKVKNKSLDYKLQHLTKEDTLSIIFSYEHLDETMKLVQAGIKGDNQAAGGNINYDMVKLVYYDIINRQIIYYDKRKGIQNKLFELISQSYNNGDPVNKDTKIDDLGITDYERLAKKIKTAFPESDISPQKCKEFVNLGDILDYLAKPII